MHWPEISQIKVENSWDIISSNTITRLDSMTLARNSFGTANLTGTVTRQILPFWLGTISATLGQAPEISTSIEYNPKADR